MKNRYDLVLLDMDGTIADTDRLIVETMYILYDKYRNGRRTPIEEIYYFSGPPIKDTLKKEFPDIDNDMLVKEFAEISYHFYDTIVTTFPHVIETLTRLKDRGILLGVVTSKSHQNSEHCLKALGLDNLINYFVAFDDVVNKKPDPEGILLAMSHFSIKNKRKVLYIGDNKSDFLAGKNAGVDVALVTYGPRKIDTSLTPTYWIDDFLEVEDIINE